MLTCPFPTHVRKELPPLIPRIAKLPVDERGYPVPWFVVWIEGKPEFRMMDHDKLVKAIKEKRCWVCGEPMGVNLCFPIGPMCVVNRVTSEPPSHRDCAEWSVKGCPFLSRPGMVRREDELTEAHKGNTAGISIDRNPGAVALYFTRKFTLENHNGVLFRLGEPDEITWWREGRTATRQEVLDSIDSGLPRLVEVCAGQEDLNAVNEARNCALKWLPK